MSALITDEMVDAAAEAAYTMSAWDAQNFTGTNWTELDPAHRTPWLREAEAALEVVAPLIAAQALRDAAGSSIPRRALAHETRSWLRARAGHIERGES